MILADRWGSPMPSPLFSRLRLPSRVALLLGMGALSAATARADTGPQVPGNSTDPLSRTERHPPAALSLWSDGERLYFAEHNCSGQELRLQDTAEARHLRQLLQEHAGAANGIRLDRMILAGGGGMGISWERARNPDPARPPQRTTESRNLPRTLEPRRPATPRQVGVSGDTIPGADHQR